MEEQELELKNSLDMQKAFTSLYLEFPPSIVNDVKGKVFAVISQLEEKVKSKESRIKELEELLQQADIIIDYAKDNLRLPKQWYETHKQQLNTYKEKYPK